MPMLWRSFPARWPSSTAAHGSLAFAYYRGEQFEEAENAARKSAELFSGPSAWEVVALAIAMRGNPVAALDELDQKMKYTSVDREDLVAVRGYIAAKAGRRKEAVYLEQGVDQKDDTAPELISDPASKPLRRTSRFHALANKAGLSRWAE
jgi:hypothetical protein